VGHWKNSHPVLKKSFVDSEIVLIFVKQIQKQYDERKTFQKSNRRISLFI